MMNYEELSKEVSYALHHAPWEYDLEMDKECWANIGQMLSALNIEGSWIFLNNVRYGYIKEKSNS